jgi:hypothetical protein
MDRNIVTEREVFGFVHNVTSLVICDEAVSMSGSAAACAAGYAGSGSLLEWRPASLAGFFVALVRMFHTFTDSVRGRVLRLLGPYLKTGYDCLISKERCLAWGMDSLKGMQYG